MEEGNIQTPSAPIESAPPPMAEPAAPVVETKEANVYGLAHGYTDASKALQGNLRTMEAEAAVSAAKAKPNLDPPRGQRFGMSDERRQQVVAEMKAAKGQLQPAVATATAPAKVAETKPAPVVDPVKRASDFVGDYFEPDSDPVGILERIYDHDYERFEKIATHLVTSNRDFALRALGIDPGPRADDPEFKHLPKELRQVAANLAPGVWDSLSYATPAEQSYHLQREKELQAREQADWQEQEREDKQFAEDVKTAQAELTKALSDMYRADHLKSLEDFKPYGHQRQDEDLHDSLLWRVSLEMQKAPKMRALHDEAQALAHNIPIHHGLGETKEAQAAEKRLREVGDEWNKEFTRRLKNHKNEYASIIQDAWAWRSLPKEQREAAKKAEAEAKQRADARKADTPQETKPFERGERIPGLKGDWYYPKK